MNQIQRAPPAAPAPIPPAALAALVSQALGVDRAAGRRVLRASRRSSVRFQRDHDHLSSHPQATAPVLDWPGAAVWSRALRADGRPLLLATLHLGCYLSALLALADRLRWLRRVTVIRRRRDDARERASLRHFERAGLEIVVLRTREHPARAALRALRRGEHVLLLYDVPPAFDVGRTATVPFLGRPAHMATGPAQLAAHAGALLWPFAMPMIDGCLRMRTREPLAPSVHTPDARTPDARTPKARTPEARAAATRAACRTATLALARFAEDCIVEAPEQWLLWTHLPALWGLPPAALQSPRRC